MDVTLKVHVLVVICLIVVFVLGQSLMSDFYIRCFAESCLPGFECPASDLRYLDRFVCRYPELCPAFRYLKEHLVQTRNRQTVQLEFNFECYEESICCVSE